MDMVYGAAAYRSIYSSVHSKALGDGPSRLARGPSSETSESRGQVLSLSCCVQATGDPPRPSFPANVKDYFPNPPSSSDSRSDCTLGRASSATPAAREFATGVAARSDRRSAGSPACLVYLDLKSTLSKKGTTIVEVENSGESEGPCEQVALMRASAA